MRKERARSCLDKFTVLSGLSTKCRNMSAFCITGAVFFVMPFIMLVFALKANFGSQKVDKELEGQEGRLLS